MATTEHNFLKRGMNDLATACLCIGLMLGSGAGAAFVDTAASKYDGFAEYAEENQLEKVMLGVYSRIQSCSLQRTHSSRKLRRFIHLYQRASITCCCRPCSKGCAIESWT